MKMFHREGLSISTTSKSTRFYMKQIKRRRVEKYVMIYGNRKQVDKKGTDKEKAMLTVLFLEIQLQFQSRLLQHPWLSVWDLHSPSDPRVGLQHPDLFSRVSSRSSSECRWTSLLDRWNVGLRKFEAEFLERLELQRLPKAERDEKKDKKMRIHYENLWKPNKDLIISPSQINEDSRIYYSLSLECF